MSPVLEARDVRRLYGRTPAVDGASLSLATGRIACLLGPSGCGKSTLLRMLAGLEPLDGGEVLSLGKTLSSARVHVPPESRDLGFVFQDYALFPHLTAAENVAFGLRKQAKADRQTRVLAELERVRLAHRAQAYPAALSGGEQQRVALARALARDPSAILLDEPFSGLDGGLKAEVRDAALSALRQAGAATLIVTHDAEEAMMMGDDLALMRDGRILQTGSPRDCYLRPVSLDAARLLGDVNVLSAHIDDGRLRTAFGDLDAQPGASVMARPEGIVLAAQGVPAVVTETRFAGAHVLLTLSAGGAQAVARAPLRDAAPVGATVHVRLDPVFCAVFG